MPPDKLSVIVFSGGYDKVHYALAMASAAAAVDRPATLFFTMEAVRALAKTAPDWTAEERANKTKGIATMAELWDACRQLDVVVLVCTMGLRSVGLTSADLRAEVGAKEGGIVAFLNDASRDGAMLFI